ncbi:MAG: DNA-deoxyinosine glycosylase [Steroidobacteraceae bacterium]|jgi:hypoxanthine-DNA glycosylase
MANAPKRSRARKRLPAPTGSARSTARVASFAPLAAPDARVLILGTMPGVASLAAAQYYAHPRNQFWTLMGELCGARAELPYAQRCRILLERGVALWDVFSSCVRPGSADSAIELAGAQLNDLVAFIDAHPALERILCNGRLAHQSYRRNSAAQVTAKFPRLQVVAVPSTSPAHAGMRAAQKLVVWRAAWPRPSGHKRR